MEYCFLKGFLVVLLIQHCKSEGLSTSIQSSTVVTLQDGQALPREPELPHTEVVPVVAPPSLKEVQQAVQEASEQVEGRGAEEVLKELLERVVEAAMGQVEGGGEAKVDEPEVHDAFEEDALGDKKGETESDTEAEVSEQTVEEKVEGEDMGAEGGDTRVGEEQEIAKVDAFEDEVEEGKGAAEGMEETAAGFVQETTADVETGGREAEGVEVIGELLDTKVSQEVVEEALAALEETGGYLAVEETEVEGSDEQVLLWEVKEAAKSETQAVEEVPAVVDVGMGGEPEEETVVDSDPSLAVADVEQLGDAWGKEETQVDEMKGEVIVPHFDNYERETTQTVAGEPVEVEDKEKVNIVKDAEGPEVDNEHGHLVVEVGDAEEVEVEVAKVGEAEGREINRGSVIKEESVALVNEVGDQQAGEEEQIASETSLDSEKEDQEVLVISAPKPLDSDEASIEQNPENQAPTPRPSLGGVETEEDTLGDEKSNNGNEIITTTDYLLPHNPVVAQPTLDNFVKDFPAEPPQAEGEEPGEANELVEDTAGNTDTSELSLEAWKIGAICAAAFLVLETVIIIIYIQKHPSCNKNSVPALQRACEEGCVEPEAATGGDCSDDTLPASNGDAQQIASHDPFDVASTLAQNKEQHEEELAIALSDLPPSSAEESVNTGPGPDSSQDLRTSIL
ncbi:immunoglobulin A1 protease isoform X1 [Etheostoma spectabile]|uniref:immunoglobulin A1 protease isoform X1 n=1 Tax=Etheostoma spectabile TaxID=54343 RepID=UPI0013AF9C84|nr:immunoglobulin A1 protease-like isoform X1 [Etheostoma spectabile]